MIFYIVFYIFGISKYSFQNIWITKEEIMKRILLGRIAQFLIF